MFLISHLTSLSTIPDPHSLVTPPKLCPLVFSPSHLLTPSQPASAATDNPAEQTSTSLTQPALRRLARLSPVFTCGTRGGRFVGSDSESEMTLSVDEALVVFCSSWTQVSSESRALG
ncbi:hypothetical protein BLNAU_22950 [Blattamonas nauphoetae]|uniref:Uncharacterized protein n=1 Tax=Blattamonas nauphoetae TaxID=2049346 RepID=A0ABQ9WRL2_9EUKA|nr:hypothetical protein BLNAU_22950 [Blattamonas nauphoetae]